MPSFDDDLQLRLDSLRERNLLRELRRVDSAPGPRVEIGGRTLLNFSSNDYLGLANHPALKTAARAAVEKFGAGAGASRLVCGSLAPFHELEEALAAFKRTEAALTFATGYAAALGAITALVGQGDILILDKLVHASIVDAARLAGAKIRVFAHNDLDDLEAKLRWAAGKKAESGPPSLRSGAVAPKLQAEAERRKAEILVVTETVFSMDGDLAPLRETVALKEKYGARLMVDEAHATGIFGADGRGRADELGVADRIEVQMGTLGKAFGASGGFIAGSRVLIDWLVNRARSLIFSTAPVPAAAAAARAGLQISQSAEGETRRQILRERIAQFNAASRQWDRRPARVDSMIIPFILGDETKALAAAARLREQGIYVPAIRYPAVARGAARLRISLTAAHTEADVAELIHALNQIGDWKLEIYNE